MGAVHAARGGDNPLRRVSLRDALGHELSIHTIGEHEPLSLGVWSTGRGLPRVVAQRVRLQLGDTTDAEAERVVRPRTALPAELPQALHSISGALPLLGVALWEVGGETWLNWGDGVGDLASTWARTMIRYGDAFTAMRGELGLGSFDTITAETADRRRLGVHVFSAANRQWAMLLCLDGAELYPHERMGGWLGRLARELKPSAPGAARMRQTQPSQPGVRL